MEKLLDNPMDSPEAATSLPQYRVIDEEQRPGGYYVQLLQNVETKEVSVKVEDISGDEGEDKHIQFNVLGEQALDAFRNWTKYATDEQLGEMK